MKKFAVSLALTGLVNFGAPAFADDKGLTELVETHEEECTCSNLPPNTLLLIYGKDTQIYKLKNGKVLLCPAGSIHHDSFIETYIKDLFTGNEHKYLSNTKNP